MANRERTKKLGAIRHSRAIHQTTAIGQKQLTERAPRQEDGPQRRRETYPLYRYGSLSIEVKNMLNIKDKDIYRP